MMTSLLIIFGAFLTLVVLKVNSLVNISWVFILAPVWLPLMGLWILGIGAIVYVFWQRFQTWRIRRKGRQPGGERRLGQDFNARAQPVPPPEAPVLAVPQGKPLARVVPFKKPEDAS